MKFRVEIDIDDMVCELLLNYTDDQGKPGVEQHICRTNPHLLLDSLKNKILKILEQHDIDTSYV